MINRAVVDMEPLVVDDQPVKRPRWHGKYCIGPGGGERLVRATFGDPEWDPTAVLGSTVSAASEREQEHTHLCSIGDSTDFDTCVPQRHRQGHP